MQTLPEDALVDRATSRCHILKCCPVDMVKCPIAGFHQPGRHTERLIFVEKCVGQPTMNMIFMGSPNPAPAATEQAIITAQHRDVPARVVPVDSQGQVCRAWDHHMSTITTEPLNGKALPMVIAIAIREGEVTHPLARRAPVSREEAEEDMAWEADEVDGERIVFILSPTAETFIAAVDPLVNESVGVMRD